MIWRLTKLRVAIEKTSSKSSKNKKRKTKLCVNLYQLMLNVRWRLPRIENRNLQRTYLPSNVRMKKKPKRAVKKNFRSRRVSD